MAAITKCPKLGGLKQQQCVLLQFWRPEVQNQVVIRAILLPLKYLGEPHVACSGSRHFLACGGITPISPYICIWPSSLLYSILSLLMTDIIEFRVYPVNLG